MSAEQIDLHGSVPVPRAALHAFRAFLNRFHNESITTREWQEKMLWIDSLLEPKEQEDRDG